MNEREAERLYVMLDMQEWTCQPAGSTALCVCPHVCVHVLGLQ